jgi:hypothetical protein
MSASHVPQADGQAATGTGCMTPSITLQRRDLTQVLPRFSRMVKSDGVLVLAYQHMLPAAWRVLREALAASDWHCCAIVPSPTQMPPDAYLYRRTLVWEAILICRQRQHCFSEKQSVNRIVQRAGKDDHWDTGCDDKTGGLDACGLKGPEEQLVIDDNALR